MDKSKSCQTGQWHRCVLWKDTLRQHSHNGTMHLPIMVPNLTKDEWTSQT